MLRTLPFLRGGRSAPSAPSSWAAGSSAAASASFLSLFGICRCAVADWGCQLRRCQNLSCVWKRAGLWLLGETA